MSAGLAERWRGEAALARRIGADAAATVLDKCASELDAARREEQLRTVTLREAAALSGYSYSALEKGVRMGRLPNAGTKHRPRLRVGDLPRKGGRPRPAAVEPDLVQRVLAGRR